MKKAILLASAMLILITSARSVMAFNPTHQFTDQTRDRASGLYDFSSRYYNPNTGRFVQPDPLQNYLVTPELEKRTGQNLEQLLKNPQRLNAYSYALNNPVNVVDPTGEVSEERQEQFNEISNYIRNDENYWLIRDRDGNAKALDAIWNKCLEISQNDKGETDVGDALDAFYDAVHIDWAHQNTLDKSYDDFEQRRNNLPSALVGEYGGNRSEQDKLQHFVASARLAYNYGGRIAGFFGRLKEIQDGFRAVFNSDYTYAETRELGGGYSQADIFADQLGVFWLNEYRSGQVNPSDFLNNFN